MATSIAGCYGAAMSLVRTVGAARPLLSTPASVTCRKWSEACESVRRRGSRPGWGWASMELKGDLSGGLSWDRAGGISHGSTRAQGRPEQF